MSHRFFLFLFLSNERVIVKKKKEYKTDFRDEVAESLTPEFFSSFVSSIQRKSEKILTDEWRNRPREDVAELNFSSLAFENLFPN